MKICPDCYCTEKCRVWDRKEKYIRIVAAIGCSVVENGRVKWQKWTEMLARVNTKKAKLNCLAWLNFLYITIINNRYPIRCPIHCGVHLLFCRTPRVSKLQVFRTRAGLYLLVLSDRKLRSLSNLRGGPLCH